MYDITVIRSHRKTLSIEITIEEKVLVRAPLYISSNQIMEFVENKSNWIDTHIQKMAERNKELNQATVKKFTRDELDTLARQALEYIPKRASYYAKIMNVSYNRITIRNQRTRWGSCSSRHNLNFNCLLMLTPPEVIDYVVVHELAHLIEANHSVRFWAEVEKIMPDYRTHKKWLKENGHTLIRRL